MITRRTRIQLIAFVVITLLGVSFVGARYARLDRLVRDDAYLVQAHFADSGGIFAGGEVTYRGVGIGTVDKLVLTADGVDVYLAIQNEWDQIPTDSKALVGNRSAVGEQYVELQPQTDDGPFLEDESEIPRELTEIPIQTDQLLTNLSDTVSSVDRNALRTTVNALGEAFGGTGEDLQTILDTGSSFVMEADRNFEVTQRLIRDGNIVLNGQLASESSFRTFADQLSKFSGTLVDADPDLRKVIDDGSFAVNQLRGFIEDNRVELGSLLNNLVTTGEIVVDNLPGLQQVLVIYPYVVEGGFTVVSKSKDTGLFDAHFGMVITDTPVCLQGYDPDERRPPTDGSREPMDEDARCSEPPAQSNARGSQNLPRAATSLGGDDVVAAYDPETGELSWGKPDAALSSPGTVAPATLGKDSWKWLYIQPMTAS
ncbi:MlaD family protein [Nocardioides sp.]|uniref:MlaD family protein n=1 Tax=Nocardioides sp. TaxID=35761 RepID=UPI0026047A2E|nr:MlaD family protein [Nocardioides sp.]